MAVRIVNEKGETMERQGSCNNCGLCCTGCKYQKWSAVVAIKKGQEVRAGIEIVSICPIRDKPELPEYQTHYIGKGCFGFPHHPVSTPEVCSFRWVKVVEA